MSVHGTSTQGLFLPSFSPSCSHQFSLATHTRTLTQVTVGYGKLSWIHQSSSLSGSVKCEAKSKHRHPCGLPPSLTLFTTVLMIQCTVFKKRRHLTYQNSSWCLWETGQNLGRFWVGRDLPSQDLPVFSPCSFTGWHQLNWLDSLSILTHLTCLQTLTDLHTVLALCLAISRKHPFLFQLHRKVRIIDWACPCRFKASTIWTHTRYSISAYYTHFQKSFSLHLAVREEGNSNLYQKIAKRQTHFQKGDDAIFPRRKTIQGIDNISHMNLSINSLTFSSPWKWF